MTSQELQIAVAEKVGWVWHYGDASIEAKSQGMAYWNKGKFDYRTCRGLAEVDPFSTSLDAIQAACLEKFTTQDEAHAFTVRLILIACTKVKPFWQLTAADWCEAFLATHEQLNGEIT